MELIHIANATFSSYSSKNNSLENLASKQKTFRIVKEHTMRCRHRAFTRAGLIGMSSRQRANVCGGRGSGWWSQPGSNRRPSGCKPDALPAELWPPDRWWVWEELHLRPHPYQGCALTN